MRQWSSVELKTALTVYNTILKNGESMTPGNPRLQSLASQIGRTIGSVVMRMGNFEYLRTGGKKGLSNAGATVVSFWNRHSNNTQNPI